MLKFAGSWIIMSVPLRMTISSPAMAMVEAAEAAMPSTITVTLPPCIDSAW